MLQPGTREAASNPIVIILSVVCGVVLVFFLINYALYVFAQQNKPRKAGKRVRLLRFCVVRLVSDATFFGLAFQTKCKLLPASTSANQSLRACEQVSKKKQRREVLRGNGSATPGK